MEQEIKSQAKEEMFGDWIEKDPACCTLNLLPGSHEGELEDGKALGVDLMFLGLLPNKMHWWVN